MSGNILIKLRSGAVTFIKDVVSERHRFETAVLLSILCHIAVLIFAQKVEIDASLSKVYIPAKEEEQRLEFEIVETQPENAVEIPPENTKFPIRIHRRGITIRKQLRKPTNLSLRVLLKQKNCPFRKII